MATEQHGIDSNMSSEAKQLLEKLESLRESGFPKMKYFHPRTVENFIYHLDSLDSVNRQLSLTTLSGYFQYIDSMDVAKDHDFSAEIFYRYLHKLSKIYVMYANFMVQIPQYVELISLVVVGTFLYFISASFTYYGI